MTTHGITCKYISFWYCPILSLLGVVNVISTTGHYKQYVILASPFYQQGLASTIICRACQGGCLSKSEAGMEPRGPEGTTEERNGGGRQHVD
jgi:hypothetical protein